LPLLQAWSHEAAIADIHPAPGIHSGAEDQREGRLAKLYETVVLIDAMLEDAAIEASVEKYRGMIAGNGEIIRVDRWGKRRMAYAISKRTHAEYVIYYYHTEKPASIAEVERALRLDESVIRFLTVVDNPVGLPPENALAAAVPEDVLTNVETEDKED
jgi:small subunit ribosomal protein S6